MRLFVVVRIYRGFQCQNGQFHCFGTVARLRQNEVVHATDVTVAGGQFVAKFECQELGKTPFAGHAHDGHERVTKGGVDHGGLNSQNQRSVRGVNLK